MVYHGPSLTDSEERRLKILRAICQATFWGCIIVALLFPYILNVLTVVAFVVMGVIAFYGEIRIGGRLRRHRNQTHKS